MNKWIKTLSERDRLIVIYGGIVISLLLYYLVIWIPLSEKTSQLVESNAQTRELIGWMKKAKIQLIQLHQQAKNKSTSSTSLLSAIEQSVKRNRLEASASDIKQLENNRVQVSFDQVSYLAVMRWIEDVQTTSASKIDKVLIKKTDKPGIVHVDLTLER